MSEKRIKAKLIHTSRWKDDPTATVPMIISEEAKNIPDGTPVEIVYREEVEIRPGQRWVQDYGTNGEQRTRFMEVLVTRDLCGNARYWHVAADGELLKPWVHHDDNEAAEISSARMTKAQLQSWLNEHAELAEGESKCK